MTTVSEFEKSFDKRTKVYQVFKVLKDMQWHCRECEYTHVGSTQIAGSGGIQGLKRGRGSRQGIIIESANHFCVNCNKTTRQDRWQGAFQSSVQGKSMPPEFVRRAIRLFGSRDIIENTERQPNQLTIDHKLPMLRWTSATEAVQTRYSQMSDEEIKDNFQLLKKSNGSVSHNLLKSRACERCFRSGNRGTPFGVIFFSSGGSKWEPIDKKDPEGCVGCGWFDFDQWRKALNQTLREQKRDA